MYTFINNHVAMEVTTKQVKKFLKDHGFNLGVTKQAGTLHCYFRIRSKVSVRDDLNLRKLLNEYFYGSREDQDIGCLNCTMFIVKRTKTKKPLFAEIA